MATTEDIKALADSLPDLSGVTFPAAIDVLKARMEAQGVTEDSLNSVNENSPALKGIDMEISQTRSQLNTLISQLPLLAVPVTIPLALATVKALLPSTLNMLANLNISIPDALTPLIEAIEAAQGIINTAKNALTPPPLNILNSILGFE